jgi:DtxR family Mn-dependent transcriptional regulator
MISGKHLVNAQAQRGRADEKTKRRLALRRFAAYRSARTAPLPPQIGDLSMTTVRMEDYLKEIFLLENTGHNITVSMVAERLGLNTSTVTLAVQKLVRAKMLDHEHRGLLYLTAEGRRKGLLVYHRYEGLRAFFHEFLGMDRYHSSKMACGMEHYMDSTTNARLYAMLDFFRRAKADKAPWVDALFNAIETPILLPHPLSVLKDGQKGFVTHLTANEKLRKRLQNTGFTTGARVTCLSATAMSLLRASLDGKELTIPRNEAAAIWLRIE